MNIKPISNYLVSVENRYIEEVVTKSGIKLFTDPSYNPTQHTTVVGKICGVPLDNSLGLSMGDEIFFSYVVIGERNYASTGHIFHSLFEKHNERFQRYSNGKGEKLNVVAMPGIIGDIWVGTHTDERNNLISGCQGSESEVNRWKAQFSFSGGDFKYKNLIPTPDGDLWAVRPDLIFAQKKGKKLLPLGDRLILNPIQLAIPKEAQTDLGIQIPQSSLSVQLMDRAELTHPVKDMNLKKGQMVAFQPNFVEQYTVDNVPYFLVRKRRIIGTYSKFALNFHEN